ncbi:DUF1254 domain-containing protein [Nocardia sp. CA-084685]|uniref:DUF1254 domain-containing protein n=1 Tax=Nocardia sp. CA-084685 TaxID=3239970 RepID=UPI003D98A9A7
MAIQHRNVFGASDFDLVHYVSYQDRLGLITANATTPYILNFIDLSKTGPLVIEVPPGHAAGGFSDFWQRDFGILGEMGARPGTRRATPHPASRPHPADGRGPVLRAPGHRHERHVRIPRPRPGSRDRPRPGQRRPCAATGR